MITEAKVTILSEKIGTNVNVAEAISGKNIDSFTEWEDLIDEARENLAAADQHQIDEWFNKFANVYSVAYKTDVWPYQSIAVIADSEEEAIQLTKEDFEKRNKKCTILGAAKGESYIEIERKGKPLLFKDIVGSGIANDVSTFNYKKEDTVFKHYKLVLIWNSGEKEVHFFDSKEKAEEVEAGYKTAFGRQISWSCVDSGIYEVPNSVFNETEKGKLFNKLKEADSKVQEQDTDTDNNKHQPER